MSQSNSLSKTEILRVVLIYGLFGALWILCSDTVVEWLFSDPFYISAVQSVKDWLYVAITAGLLYGLLQGNGNGSTETRPLQCGSWRLPMLVIALIILFASAAAILHALHHHRLQATARLEAVAEIKSRQIADWLVERRADADLFRSSAYLTDLYRRWKVDGYAESGSAMTRRLDELCRIFGVLSIELFDPNGTSLYKTQTSAPEPTPLLHSTLETAIRDQASHWIGPYRDVSGKSRIDFIVPLSKIPAPSPLLMLNVDPAAWLFPTLSGWPEPSESSEALLLRRDGNNVEVINPRRQITATAGSALLPKAEQSLWSEQNWRKAALEHESIIGFDDRNVSVLASVREISGTDWFLLAKTDLPEIYQDIWSDAFWISLTGLMALFTTAIGGLLLQKSERLNISATIQQFQAERLQTMQLLNAIAEGSDDAIFAKDPEGRYLLCNQATVRFVGKPADEILGSDDTAIFPADQAAILIATNRRIREENCIVRCEEHLDLPDGPRVFLTTKGPLHDEQGKPMGTFGIARDITARKQAEDDLISQTAELRRQNEELQRFNRASVGRELAMVDLKREINELCRQLGREPPYDPAALERMFVGSRDSANE